MKRTLGKPQADHLLFTIPIKLPSLANVRMHWRAMDRLKKEQKWATSVCMMGIRLPALPVVVTITRYGPRKLDSDNLESACKYVRDEIARAFGVDDGDDRYTWICKQEIDKEYRVVVDIFGA